MDATARLRRQRSLANLHGQRVRSHKRVRPRVEWPGAEVDDSFVQLTGHHAHLRLESRVMLRVSTNFPIRRVETPSR